MANWSDDYSINLTDKQKYQIANGSVVAIVKNDGPGTVKVGSGPSIASGQFILTRENSPTLVATNTCTVHVRYAAL